MPGIGLGIGVGIAEVVGGSKGPRPKLDLKFASTLSLTSSSGITPSFSRASSGTYFGSDGLLKYANVNLLQYSEQFDNAYWAKISSTVTQNTTASPTGSNTADSLFEASGVNYHGLFPSSGISVNIGQSYTLSAYVKKGNRKYFAIGYGFNVGLGSIVQFDLDSATTVYSFANGGYAVVSSSATDVGNGWIRISAVLTSNTATVYPTFINTNALFTTGNIHQNTYSGDPTKFTYIWGAQLEIGSTPGTYVPTTNAANSAPRFDFTYNGTSWVSKGLLVEEQRTNLVPRSEDFNTDWYKNAISVSSNSIASPDGRQTADKLIPSAANTFHGLYTYPLMLPSTGIYTVSTYVKSGEYSKPLIMFLYDVSRWAGVQFNLSTGSVIYSASLSYSLSSSSIAPVGGGWYRISATCNLNATTSYIGFSVSNNDWTSGSIYDFAYSGDGTSGAYFWGAQVEAGSFPTSYIPTTSASATRSADVCQITGSDFSSFWNASEGSFAVEGDSVLNIGTTGSSREYILVGAEKTSTSNESVTIWKRNADGYSRSITLVGGAYTSELASPSVWADGATAKIGFGFRANDFASSFNGSAVSTDTSGAMPSGLEELAIGYLRSSGGSIGGFWNGHIARLRYYNKRLPNATLQKLST